jgi:hypothetical protein
MEHERGVQQELHRRWGFGIRVIVPYVNVIRIDFGFGRPIEGMILHFGIMDKAVVRTQASSIAASIHQSTDLVTANLQLARTAVTALEEKHTYQHLQLFDFADGAHYPGATHIQKSPA